MLAPRTPSTRRYVDGNVYHGEFFEDEIHGMGRLTICPGSILEEVYDGEFVRGVKHGRGIYVYRKGDGLVREPCMLWWSVSFCLSDWSGTMGLRFRLWSMGRFTEWTFGSTTSNNQRKQRQHGTAAVAE